LDDVDGLEVEEVIVGKARVWYDDEKTAKILSEKVEEAGYKSLSFLPSIKTPPTPPPPPHPNPEKNRLVGLLVLCGKREIIPGFFNFCRKNFSRFFHHRTTTRAFSNYNLFHPRPSTSSSALLHVHHHKWPQLIPLNCKFVGFHFVSL